MNKHFVDTNIFVYLLFQVDTRKQQQCKELFKRAEKGRDLLWTTEWVVAELVWFFMRQKQSVDSIKKIILNLLATKGLEVKGKELLLAVIDVWSDNIDFIDAVNVVLAEREGIRKSCSYDKDLDKLAFIKRREP